MSRSVVFTWMEPHDNNAPILGYFVLYKQPSFAGGEEVVQQVADKTVHVFELLPGVTYNLTVIAYNEIGNSTESESLTVKTLEEGKVPYSAYFHDWQNQCAIYSSFQSTSECATNVIIINVYSSFLGRTSHY